MLVYAVLTRQAGFSDAKSLHPFHAKKEKERGRARVEVQAAT